jgi:chorismate mutase
LKDSENISKEKKLTKQLDKIVLSKKDIILFSKTKKQFILSNKEIVFDCSDTKKWNDIKGNINAAKTDKIKLFGVLLNDFKCNKNADLKLFSRLKLNYPSLKIIFRIDEKKYHIDTIQSALNLGFDFLYIDAEKASKKMMNSIEKLPIRCNEKVDDKYFKVFSELRKNIDKIDDELLELLSKRNNAIKEIGKIKLENDLKIFQPKRWKTILNESLQHAKKYGIDKDELKKILETIHIHAIKTQLKIYSKKVNKKPQ